MGGSEGICSLQQFMLLSLLIQEALLQGVFQGKELHIE